MNIIIFVSSLSFGGAEKQAVIDANLLCEKFTIYLVNFWGGPLRSQLNQKVNYYELKKGGYIGTSIRLIRFIRKNNISLIMSSLFAPITISSLAALYTRTPVYWFFHSHEYEIPLRSLLAYKILSKSRTVKKLLFVNNELKESLSARYLFPLDKTGIFYNSSQFSKEIKPNVFKEKSERVNIGFVGRVIELKRIEYLLDLADYLNKNGSYNYQIIIVGDGDKLKDLTKSAQNMKISESVHFEGFQLNTDQYYRQFDIFVNPSREECLSMVLIDAGMSGIPSVAFDTGGNNEIIINNKTGYIVATKEEYFIKIKDLIDNRELRKQMGEAASIHCKKLFSLEKHGQELENIVKLIN